MTPRALRAMFVLALSSTTALAACSSTQASSDAGPDSDVPSSSFDANESCATTADCEIGLVCAYAVDGGCGALGECIYGDCVEDPSCPPVPTTPACGCSGADVAYVTAAYAQSPVSSPTPCPGVDASAPDAGSGDASVNDGAAAAD